MPSLRKLGDLSNFHQLSEIKFHNCFHSDVLHDALTSKSLNLLYIYGCDIDIKHDGELNCKFVFECCRNFNFNGSKVKDIEIVNSSIIDLKGLESLEELHTLKLEKNFPLKTLSGLKNLPKLQALKLIKNLLLNDIKNLTGLPQLKSIQLSNLDSLKNVSPLAKIETLETLDIVDCEYLDVKPRPLGLIQKEKVFSYQLKLSEFYKLDNKTIKEKAEKMMPNQIQYSCYKTMTMGFCHASYMGVSYIMVLRLPNVKGGYKAKKEPTKDYTLYEKNGSIFSLSPDSYTTNGDCTKVESSNQKNINS